MAGLSQKGTSAARCIHKYLLTLSDTSRVSDHDSIHQLIAKCEYVWVRFQILSDIHLESPAAYDIFEIAAKSPNLELLGDIGNACDEGFFSFLEAQL